MTDENPRATPRPTPAAGTRRTTPTLLPERVGRGTAFALLAVPAGAVVSAALWRLGLVSTVAGLVVGVLAVTLYAYGSDGRLRRGVPVVVLVTLVGLAVSLFAGAAIDLWADYARLEANIASVFGSRWGFVADNLFYPGLLRQYPRTITLLLVLGAVGASLAALRLARSRRR